MKHTLKVGETSAAPGGKVRGRLAVATAGVSTIEMPFTVINGDQDGPIFAVTAGVHGTEYAGIEATMRLAKTIEPEDLSGAMVLVHIVNVPSFEARSPFLCPLDGLNVNRVFPGSAEGSMSHRLAHTVFSQVVAKADYYVDLHSGDIPEEHIDVTYYPMLGSKTDTIAEKMARNFSTSYIERFSVSGASATEACRMGVPAIVSESGELGKLEEHAVNFHLDGVVNLMRTFKLLREPPKPTNPRILGDRVIVRANNGGFLHRKVKTGTSVSKGEILGEIVSIYGDTMATLTAPIEGVILMAYPSPAVNAGDYLFCICPLES